MSAPEIIEPASSQLEAERARYQLHPDEVNALIAVHSGSYSYRGGESSADDAFGEHLMYDKVMAEARQRLSEAEAAEAGSGSRAVRQWALGQLERHSAVAANPTEAVQTVLEESDESSVTKPEFSPASERLQGYVRNAHLKAPSVSQFETMRGIADNDLLRLHDGTVIDKAAVETVDPVVAQQFLELANPEIWVLDAEDITEMHRDRIRLLRTFSTDVKALEGVAGTHRVSEIVDSLQAEGKEPSVQSIKEFLIDDIHNRMELSSHAVRLSKMVPDREVALTLSPRVLEAATKARTDADTDVIPMPVVEPVIDQPAAAERKAPKKLRVAAFVGAAAVLATTLGVGAAHLNAQQAEMGSGHRFADVSSASFNNMLNGQQTSGASRLLETLQSAQTVTPSPQPVEQKASKAPAAAQEQPVTPEVPAPKLAASSEEATEMSLGVYDAATGEGTITHVAGIRAEQLDEGREFANLSPSLRQRVTGLLARTVMEANGNLSDAEARKLKRGALLKTFGKQALKTAIQRVTRG